MHSSRGQCERVRLLTQFFSIHYEMPKATHVHKSMLLRGVKFSPPALNQSDIEATKGRASKSGRSYGGAPLQSGSRGRNSMHFTSSNQYTPRYQEGQASPQNYTNSNYPAPPPGRQPPPPNVGGFARGPPPPPPSTFEYSSRWQVQGLPDVTPPPGWGRGDSQYGNTNKQQGGDTYRGQQPGRRY